MPRPAATPTEPNLTRRRQGELMRAVCTELAAAPDGLRAAEAIARTERRVPPTAWEQGEYASGGRRYEKVLRFATIGPVKAGWMVKESGRWFLTEAGREALRTIPDPAAFERRVHELYREWRRQQPDVLGAEDDAAGEDRGGDDAPRVSIPDAPGGAVAAVTFEQAEDQAWTEIERHLGAMPPYDFQEVVAALLRGMGYHVGWVAPPGRDGGIDILAFNDPLGTRPPRIKVQVKRQQARVDVHGLRAFMALLAADDVGIFVNAGGFTRDAQEEARTQQTRRVTLLDLERLVDLWKEHYARLDEAARRRLPLQPIYFLAPEG